MRWYQRAALGGVGLIVLTPFGWSTFDRIHDRFVDERSAACRLYSRHADTLARYVEAGVRTDAAMRDDARDVFWSTGNVKGEGLPGVIRFRNDACRY